MGGKFRFAVFTGVLTALVAAGSIAFAISQGYSSDDAGLKPGMAARLSDDSQAGTPKVERATDSDIEKFVGVATRIEDNSVTIASSSQSVYVENNGEVTGFVSDLNGEVKQGDQLTLSPLRGILAKADPQSKIILGIALEDFKADGSETHEIKTADGTKIVNISQVKLNLDQKSILDSQRVDSSLERLGKAIVGKEVSEIRMVVALIIFLVVILAEGTIIYGAISSAITSIGRNPLARSAIRKELLKISMVAVVVLAVGLGAIYLVLWA